MKTNTIVGKRTEEFGVQAPMNQPYIGVTAFMNHNQVMQALSYMPPNSNRKLMVGVLASSTTLLGEPNKLPGRFPPIHTIGDIFADHALAFNVVHYATRDRETLLNQLGEIVSLAPDLIHGIQLNIVWPDPEVVAVFKQSFPNIKLILQVGPKAFEEANRSKDEIYAKFKPYEGTIDYVLLDDSGGYGKEMDPSFLLWLIRKLKAKKYAVNIVVAGGLSPSNLKLIEPIVEEVPDVSIDAEGNLRNDHKNCLDMNLVRQYLTAAPEYLVFP
jgi:phosphoribosylanthranilate isomerase